MNLTPEQIRWIFVYLFVLIVSVAIHEFGHAIMATKLGDDTPRRQGRVTLNPLAHADPIGTFLLPLVGAIYGAASGHGGGGFGWGKPVQWQPHRIHRGISMATASILVSVAGPAMNVVLGTVIAIVHVLLVKHGAIAPRGDAAQILAFACSTNFLLFFFNLLPLPPLDGGWVLQALWPSRHRATLDKYLWLALPLLFAVILIPQLTFIITAPTDFVVGHLYALAAKIL